MLSVAFLAVVGCQREEEIAHYKVPRLEALPVVKDVPVRFVAAIVPDKEQSWFLRMDGPVETITPHVPAFEKFLHTIRLTDKKDEPITWELPSDWERHPGVTSERMGRRFQTYATLKIKAQPQPVEIAVSTAGGTVLDNINRWRGQIGLAAMGEKELASETKTVDAGGVKITWINMTGVGGGMAPPRPRLDAAKLDDDEPKIQFQLPAGWKEQRATTQFAVKQFDTGNKDLKVTLTPSGGGLAANVKRWRDMAQLPDLRGKDFESTVQSIAVGELKAAYVDIENAQEPRVPRTLGVIIPGRGSDWIVKMWGPAEAVGREKANFEALVKSLRFDGK